MCLVGHLPTECNLLEGRLLCSKRRSRNVCSRAAVEEQTSPPTLLRQQLAPLVGLFSELALLANLKQVPNRCWT